MKERPILMNSEMVRAVLAGRKTVTRRLAKGVCDTGPDQTPYWPGLVHGGDFVRPEHCPIAKPSDRLYVRESYAPRYFDNGAHGYMADWTENVYANAPKWTPSIHMPRAAARIFLDVVSVRVERLRDITEADAISEGAPLARIQHAREDGGGPIIDGFANLWDSLAPEGSRWSDNPWVWRIEFARAAA